jgi:hypothetical protein
MFYLSSSGSVLVDCCRLVQESEADGLFVDISSRISIPKPDQVISVEITKVRGRVNADASIARWTSQWLVVSEQRHLLNVVSEQQRLLSDVPRFNDRRRVVSTIEVVATVATMLDIPIRRSILNQFHHILLICSWQRQVRTTISFHFFVNKQIGFI